MPIRKLSPLLVNQIAAGEVIERPASVVKELVENSLDAGATRVDVTVEEGGRSLIRISDNGVGIPADELPLAVAPHATSKLSQPEDLAAIATFGFRGEAVASIASVSRMRITSRASVEGVLAEGGAVIEASGDVIEPVRPVAASAGTIVEVRDLFFNTPARRKFMRAAPTEFGQVADVLMRIALANPQAGFTLTHGNRLTMECPAGQSRRERCVELLGRELEEGLLEFESEQAGAGTRLDSDAQAIDEDLRDLMPTNVWGLAGVPAIARATAKFQYVCLNGRPIRDRQIAHAVREAYRGLLPPDRQPVAVVFLQIDPRMVDVNVHPAKAEVRFREPQRVHGLVISAIRQRLLAADLTPRAELGAPAFGTSAPAFDVVSPVSEPAASPTPNSPLATAAAPPASPLAASAPTHGVGQPVSSGFSAQSFVDYFRRMAPQQKGLVYQEVKRAIEEETGERLPDLDAATSGTPQPAIKPLTILQVHDSYVVTQDEQGIVIIDQHALHERVMFEELRQRVGARNLESQRLLMPAVLRASAKRQAMLDTLKPLLERIGVDAEPLGPDAVGIQAFPSFLFDRNVDPVEFMVELLDRAEDEQFTGGKQDDEAVLHEVLDMMACKAAVKAGDAMTHQELTALLAKRDEIERSSNCPHGRPTTIRLTLHELEKQFKRT